MKGCRNKVFSSQAMSHCHKLRYRVFSALPPHLFLIKAILPQICWLVFLGGPHIHLTSIISRLIQFQIFYIFLKGSYTVNMLLKMSLFWTFWKFNLPLFVIFYIHLRCTYHVRPAPILSICLFFLNLSLFLRFEFTWRAPIMTITDLPLFQTLSIILTCVYHVNNSLNMSPLTFYFHLACT